MNKTQYKQTLDALKRIEEVTGQLYSFRPDDVMEFIESDLDPKLAARIGDLDSEELATALVDALSEGSLLEAAEIAWREAIEKLIREKSI